MSGIDDIYIPIKHAKYSGKSQGNQRDIRYK
jgi:hypothetical protein